MDKHRNERISIRINGKERVLLSEEELNQEISAAKEHRNEDIEIVDSNKTDILEWEDFEEEEEDKKLSNVIDFEERRNGRGSSKNKVSNRIKPFPFTSEKKHPHPLIRKKKKMRVPLQHRNNRQVTYASKFAAVIISAIIIGIGFGYIVLSLFTDLNGGEQASGNLVEAGHTQSAGQNLENKQGVGLGTASTETTAAAMQNNGIAPLKVSVIQGGAFATIESANQFAKNMQESGAAAVVLPESNPVLMFIGLAGERGELEGISERYKEKGQEIYVKPFELHGIEPEKVSGLSEATYVSNSISFYQALLTISSTAFQTGAINDDMWQKATVLHTQWNQSKPDEAVPSSIDQFGQAISTAYDSLLRYQNSNREESYLWKSQQALLEGLLSYKKWHDSHI